MPTYHDVDTRLESALKEVLVDAGITIEIFTSFQDQSETKTLPSLSIKCLGGVEDSLDSGNERLSLVLDLRSSALKDADANPTPGATHKANWGAVLDVIWDSELADLLSATDQSLTVMDSIVRARGPNNTVENSFMSEITLNMSVAPSTIA